MMLNFFLFQIIVSGAARKPSDVYLYTKCTLLSACLEEKEVEMATTDDIDPVKECIQFLEENEFITLKKVPNTSQYHLRLIDCLILMAFQPI